MKNKESGFKESQQNLSPADFPLGSLESRAAARAMLDGEGRLWEQQAWRKFEQLRDKAVAAGQGTDTPEWKALEEFMAYCQTEAPKHGAHTPQYREWKRLFNAYCELSDQVDAAGAKADPESVRLVREWRDFYSECVREWRAEGVLDSCDRALSTDL